MSTASQSPGSISCTKEFVALTSAIDRSISSDTAADLLAAFYRVVRAEVEAAFRAELADQERTTNYFSAQSLRRKAELDAVSKRLSAVLDLCDTEQRGAMRWENPLPVPDWVAPVQRAALGDDKRSGATS